MFNRSLEALVDPVWFVVGGLLLILAVRWWRRDIGVRACLAYAALATVMVAPALYTSKLQVATDYLAQFPPWRSTDSSLEGARNPLLTDVALQIRPLRELVRQRLLAGEMPLWSHELGTGQPLAGAAQSAPFAPLSLMSLPLPVGRGMTVAAAWQTLVALLGAHLLALSCGIGRSGAALAAVTFGTALHATVWLYYPLAMTAAWLPMALAALIETWRGLRRSTVALAFATSSLVLSGHPQVGLQAGLVLVLAASWLSIRRPAPERARPLLRLGVAFAVTAAIVAPFVVAVAESASESERRWLLEQTPAPAGSEFLERAIFAIAPFARGGAAAGEWVGGGNFQERATLYGGLIPTALMAAGLVTGIQRCRTLVAVGLLPFLASVLPLQQWLSGHWILAQLVDRRARVLWILVVAVAAGAAVERLSTDRRLRRTFAVLLLLCTVAAITLHPVRSSGHLAVWKVVALIAAAGSLVAVGGRLGPRLGGQRLLVAGTALELVVLGAGYNPASSARPGDPPPTEVRLLTERVAEAGQPIRIAAVGGRLLPYVPAAGGLWDPRGWDPMRPAAAAQLVRRHLHHPRRAGQILLRPDADLDFLGFLGVRYVLAGEDWAPGPRWREIFRHRGNAIWEHPAARDLFFVPADLVVAGNRAAALSAGRYAPGSTRVALEQEPGEDLALDGVVGAVTAVSNGFDVEIDPRARTLVASSVTWMPGWRARSISGREVMILRLQGAFLGFVAEPGDGRVQLRYAPRYWNFAMTASVTMAFVLLAVGIFRRRRAALAAALLVGACSGPERLVVVERQIRSDPYDYFLVDRAFVDRTVLEVEEPAGAPVSENDENPPIAVLDVELDADVVGRIDVTMSNMPRGELHLFWRGEGQAFSTDRHTYLPGMQIPGGAGHKTFRFDLGQHRGWSGRVTGLQLVTGRRHRSEVRFERLSAVERSADTESLRRAAEQNWKVDLGHDLRSAVYVPPEAPRSWKVDVPEEARIRSAYGLLAGATSAVRFRLAVREASGSERLLAETTLDPDSAGVWREGEVDLGELAGRSVELVLSTRIENGERPLREFPMWANPTIVAPRQRPAMPNVVLVSIDTLRADAVSREGEQPATTPNLARRAAERGVDFRTAIAAAPSTLPSHASMLTGLDAFRHGALFDAASPQLETLAELLRDLGYATFARTGGGYMNPRWGLYQGFDTYRYWLDHEDRAGELDEGVDDAVAWIERQRASPFFLFLHTYEVHSPYRARQPHFEELYREPPAFEDLVWIEASEGDESTGFKVPRRAEYRRRGPDPNVPAGPAVDAATARRYYASSVRHVDAGLERIWRALDRLDLWRETLVIVTSDHGEAFGEHGVAGHGYLWDHNLEVPLIVFPPGPSAPRSIDAQVRLVDLLPTAIELVGGDVPASIDGVSLVPFLRGGSSTSHPREAWSYAGNSNYGVALRVGGRAKWIQDNTAWRSSEPRRQLYRIAEDPEESSNLAGSDPLAAELERRTLERLRAEQVGLQVELHNESDRRLALRLAGVGPSRLKLLDAGDVGLIWRDGAAEIELEPGEGRWLLIEAVAGRELELEFEGAAPRGAGKVPAIIDASRRQPVGEETWSCGPGICRPATAGDVDRPLRVVLRRRGDYSVDAAPPSAPDAELIRQLQALGYVH